MWSLRSAIDGVGTDEAEQLLESRDGRSQHFVTHQLDQEPVCGAVTARSLFRSSKSCFARVLSHSTADCPATL